MAAHFDRVAHLHVFFLHASEEDALRVTAELQRPRFAFHVDVDD
jgi:hypothetical protein